LLDPVSFAKPDLEPSQAKGADETLGDLASARRSDGTPVSNELFLGDRKYQIALAEGCPFQTIRFVQKRLKFRRCPAGSFTGAEQDVDFGLVREASFGAETTAG
jgi:hypothetical protein